ncbi:hypothetical protein Pcinc_010553 [Petrolisthes cinctipes]|uniref:Uncharacterized protein n=1 Tax=Petrolisthes cinctipes TaxID=88211 RepID=A0AAE1G2K6_PETCI|nr:hypothetical protein Pcinc_010553 [Petrolisthes cinctipes]
MASPREEGQQRCGFPASATATTAALVLAGGIRCVGEGWATEAGRSRAGATGDIPVSAATDSDSSSGLGTHLQLLSTGGGSRGWAGYCNYGGG